MVDVIYLLCALTSIACCVMLFIGYRRSRARFLLWSSLCFLGLMINNVLLFIGYDNVVFPNIDVVAPWLRTLPALLGLLLLLYGLIWDTE